MQILVAIAVLAAPALPVDGEPFDAKLTAIDADWQTTLAVDGKPRELPAAELVYWGRCAESKQGPLVLTANGGMVVGDIASADKEAIAVDFTVFGALKLPLPSLAGIVFDPPSAMKARDAVLDRVARARGDSDRILLRNGDELSGTFEGITLGNADVPDKVRLTTEVGLAEIETDRIAAVIFNPALRERRRGSGLRAWVGFADGTRMLADKLTLDDASLNLTAAGQKLEAPPEELVWLQPIGGRAVYLSRLRPAGYRHIPFLDLKWPYKTDRNVTGGQLRCDGQLHPFGLGMHSTARLTYLLPKPYRRFQAELGIDDSTEGRGSIRARVYVDGKQKHATETICGGDAPVPISVDVTDGKRLDVIIDFADRADEHDHANWLNARLIP